jgi:prepilin-type N-terminal cleavage/methylation domain-containing protein
MAIHRGKGLRKARGFTLVEIMLALAVMAVGTIGLVSAIIGGMRLEQINAEKALARNAAERVLSGLRGHPNLREAYARYGGGGSGETFDVRGLSPVPGESAGRVIVWRIKSATPKPDPQSAWDLDGLDAARVAFGPFPLPFVGNETAAGGDFFDTDGDGDYDDDDDPSIMPVTVRIRWKSRSGVRTEHFSTVLGVK